MALQEMTPYAVRYRLRVATENHWGINSRRENILFARMLAGDSVRAEQRIDDLAVSMLRANVARRSAADLLRENPILDTAAGRSAREGVLQTESDSDLLQALNHRMRDFGIAVDRLRLERPTARGGPN